ncbi:glucan biosynthesis protein [Rhodovulum visakhapatnamense]|uniref:Glucans biosynthesis protein n=1 Tax=Rhodovulum visakhapatnamense TaxID=364297 RepID=A0A4R8FNQ7_9RHOB|nr:glucan biosynthesis protein [Rhodovulum visakhapatnamense]TDX27994.1 glucans biosynthesis protein [Rhodovulum visakhapatnamense]
MFPVSSSTAVRSGRFGPSRRRLLAALAGSAASVAFGLPRFAAAQEAPPEPEPEAPPPVPEAAPEPVPEPVPFSFDVLSDQMQARAKEAHKAASLPEGPLSGLDYDAYRSIRFRPDHARWAGDGSYFQLHAFHPGWLYKEPVEIFELVEGIAQPLHFSGADFQYDGKAADLIPPDFEMPGVAGFRLHAPFNRADTFDEVVVFQGASYFRALGRANVYGLSARGLAVNTASGKTEEFPRFSTFWLERPAPGATSITIYAALDSKSLTGAYRFIITPGATTVMDVTARLFMREDVDQLGIAPLTSMFLLGDNDRGDFDDFRHRVHDSEMLILNTSEGGTFVRPLNNPPRLASSYLAARDPESFGLIQRNRNFDDYLDAGAHYERRPSMMVEPVGNWGRGTVRLVEIPSDLEANDNIVAFWVPEEKARKGDTMEYDYRLHWGTNPPGAVGERAHVVRTLVGRGGVAGAASGPGLRKFVVDFEGGTLGELPDDADVKADVYASTGRMEKPVFSRIPGSDTWRLVVDITADTGALVELKAEITGYGQTLTETWLYQWINE